VARNTIKAAEIIIPGDLTDAESPPLLKWWYSGPKARGYMCRRRAEEVVAALADAPADSLILDLGSSWGLAALTATQNGYRAVALDIVEDDLRAGAKIARANGLAVWFVRGDAAAMPFRDGSFSTIVSAETVEHVFLPDRPKAFQEMARVLKNGGALSISTPNPRSPAEFFKRVALKFPAVGKLLRYTHMPAGLTSRNQYHPHRYHEPFTRAGLKAALLNAGFRICEIRLALLMYKYCPDALYRLARYAEWVWEKTPFLKNTCMTVVVTALKPPAAAPSPPPPSCI